MKFTIGSILRWVILAGVVLSGVGLWNYATELQTTAVSKQNGLNASYKSAQNYLSAYISGFYELIGVANLKSAKFDLIISNAVKGRYEGDTSAQPGGGTLFSAIMEAYPDIDLAVFDRIVDYVQSGRPGYKNIQDGLLDQLRNFDTWRQSGILQSRLIAFGGFPDRNLMACAGPDDCKYGEEAVRRMWNIVLTESTEDAYKTSKMAPLVVPND